MNAPLSSVRVLAAHVDFFEQVFRKPLQLSSGLITHITEARVRVRVAMDERTSEGMGSIYLSDLWTWPAPTRSHGERDSIVRDHYKLIAERLPEWCGIAAHPLELGTRLHHEIAHHELLPVLATAMCASPFDAAIHNASGQALGISAFQFYNRDCPVPSADSYFKEGSAIFAVRKLLSKEPATAIPG